MSKYAHEIRDPIHTFIKLDSDERKVLSARPVQRLRHIHQLAMTSYVYPGATHCRFEHSLGVMELAGKVFDVITHENHRHDSCRSEYPDPLSLNYWRRVLRMAALCHDIGHLPFSHAGEGLLKKGECHELISKNLIESAEMDAIWTGMTPPLRKEDIVKLALGPKELKKISPDINFDTWETILSEVIVGNTFGVDRMDYLLRDSLHIGVVYGSFDHYRMIETLRVLPATENDNQEPMLGIEKGGIHTAETLILARHFMFTQVYCHPIRRIYDIHLKDFLKKVLDKGRCSVEPEEHLKLTDAEVISLMRDAARNTSHPSHKFAKRIIERNHFRCLYETNYKDIEDCSGNPIEKIFKACCEKFGEENVRKDVYVKEPGFVNFPVLSKSGKIEQGRFLSKILNEAPLVNINNIFIDKDSYSEALDWLDKNKSIIMNQ